MKRIGKRNREIEKINKKLASMSLNREERNNYEYRKKAILDEISAIDYATKKGLQQGIDQAKIEMVKEMLKKETDIKFIEDVTKLKKEEIEEIKKQI